MKKFKAQRCTALILTKFGKSLVEWLRITHNENALIAIETFKI